MALKLNHSGGIESLITPAASSRPKQVTRPIQAHQ
jgi:hypothetical protein